MPFIRALISGWDEADPKRDKITNTIYFWDHGVQTSWQTLADDIHAAFMVGQQTYMTGVNRVEVKLYSLEDPAPRAPRAVKLATVAMVGSGVRETALCLSFRGEPNTPRTRGRIFLGPFGQSNQGARPAESLRTACLALADRFAGIGGVDVDWCVFSSTSAGVDGDFEVAFKPVKHSWVDDAWDTQRSRGLPPTTRTTDTHDE